VKPPTCIRCQPGDARRKRHEPPSKNPGDRRGVEDGLGRDVEGAARIVDEREAVGLADVVGVHGLEAEAVDVRYEGDAAAPDDRGWEERAGEKTPDAARSFALEDQAGT
jgi:hypothetical protein